jgi:multidrug transporter EmrE-like cation transporter
MIYLALSILSSTFLGFLFKLFPKYGVHTYQAIVINYIVCVLCGWAMLGTFPLQPEIVDKNWFPYAMVLGGLFIIGFNVAAYTIQQFGVTVGAVMQKMSIVMSVAWTLIIYHESAGWLKIIGLIAALLAILFTNKPSEETIERIKHKPGWLYIFPLLTLIISGCIEIMLFEVEQINSENADVGFIATLFGMAGLLGGIGLIGGLATKKMKWETKNLWAGIGLGVPNFFSIYYLLKVLGIGMEGSVAFPVNNVGIIALSALLAYALLREKLSFINWTGVALSLVAIILIALSN